MTIQNRIYQQMIKDSMTLNESPMGMGAAPKANMTPNRGPFPPGPPIRSGQQATGQGPSKAVPGPGGVQLTPLGDNVWQGDDGHKYEWHAPGTYKGGLDGKFLRI